MTLELADPALRDRIRHAERAVLDHAEHAALARARGSLSTAQLDRLDAATLELHELRLAHISGTPPD